MSSTQDKEITSARSEKPDRPENANKRSSRRKMLHIGLAAAAATMGAGVLIEKNSGIVHAAPLDNTGNFSSSNASVPAVTATGTNSAVGVQATSDSGNGVYASSSGSDGIHAISGGTGHSGVFAEGVSGGFGVYSKCRGGTAVVGEGGSGTGVYGYSDGGGGIGVVAYSPNGTALKVNGPMQLTGSAVGQATIPAGKNLVTVTSSVATASSNILLTPLGNPKGNLWVTRTSGSFTIHAATQSVSLPIAYLIIN
ncbi:MAG TPA: hypothetical protein VIY29_12960 [Ktedonobacteraceae bacterium]